MTVTLLGFPDMVRRFASQARASAGSTLDFTIGSTFRALAEAQAGLGLWFQWQMLNVLRQTRAGTSVGTELDTFVADFGLTRLPASPAGGNVTLSRYTPGTAAFIPLGATVRSTDGAQTFAIVADTTNPAWTGAGYALPASGTSVTVPAQAAMPGAAGNVLAGAVTVLTSAIAGIDTAINAAPFSGGLDAESDAALRDRFRLFVDSRSRGTEVAALYAIASLRQGLTAVVIENVPGSYTVVVDDGSGAPPSALLGQAFAACDAVRPLGIALYVVGPQRLEPSVSMVISAAPGYIKNDLIGPVAQTLLSYANSLPIGTPLAYTRLATLAYSVPGVAEVDNVLLAGGTANVGGGAAQVVRLALPDIAVA